jgi:hypothetical protein
VLGPRPGRLCIASARNSLLTFIVAGTKLPFLILLRSLIMSQNNVLNHITTRIKADVEFLVAEGLMSRYDADIVANKLPSVAEEHSQSHKSGLVSPPSSNASTPVSERIAPFKKAAATAAAALTRTPARPAPAPSPSSPQAKALWGYNEDGSVSDQRHTCSTFDSGDRLPRSQQTCLSPQELRSRLQKKRMRIGGKADTKAGKAFSLQATSKNCRHLLLRQLPHFPKPTPHLRHPILRRLLCTLLILAVCILVLFPLLLRAADTCRRRLSRTNGTQVHTLPMLSNGHKVAHQLVTNILLRPLLTVVFPKRRRASLENMVARLVALQQAALVSVPVRLPCIARRTPPDLPF